MRRSVDRHRRPPPSASSSIGTPRGPGACCSTMISLRGVGVRLWLVGLLACATLLGPVGIRAAQAGTTATATATTIATLHGFTPVRAWNGVQAWTDYSAADRRWHVV